MKSALLYPSAILLSIASLSLIEGGLMFLFADNQSCFLHNNWFGIFIACIGRLFFLLLSTIFFYQLFVPQYKTLKDRMLERDAEDEKRRAGIEKRQEQLRPEWSLSAYK